MLPHNAWTPTQLSRSVFAWYDGAAPWTITTDAANRVTGWANRARKDIAGDLEVLYTYGPLRGPNGRVIYDDTIGMHGMKAVLAVTPPSVITMFTVASHPGSIRSSGSSPRLASLATAGDEDFYGECYIALMLEPSAGASVLQYRGGSTVAAARAWPNRNLLTVFTSEFGTQARLSVSGHRNPYTSGTITAFTGVTRRILVGGTPTYGSNERWQGDINETLWCEGALSPSAIEKVEGYLAHKWGSRLAPKHRYAQRAPVRGPSFAGFSAPSVDTSLSAAIAFGVTTNTPTLDVEKALAAAATIALTTTATLVSPKPLTASVAVAVTTGTPVLSVPKALSAAVTISATTSAALGVAKPLNAAVAIAVTSTSNLTFPATTASVSIAVTTNMPALSVPKGLAAAVSASVVTSAALVVAKPLSASVAVAVTTSPPVLGVPKALAAAVSASVTMTGAIGAPKPLDANVALALSCAGTLTVPKGLTAAVTVTVVTTGNLTLGDRHGWLRPVIVSVAADSATMTSTPTLGPTGIVFTLTARKTPTVTSTPRLRPSITSTNNL